MATLTSRSDEAAVGNTIDPEPMAHPVMLDLPMKDDPSHCEHVCRIHFLFESSEDTVEALALRNKGPANICSSAMPHRSS